MIVTYSFLWIESMRLHIQSHLYHPKSNLPDRRDVVAFRNLFEPVGLSWMQFKALRASEALDWVGVVTGDMSQFKSQIIDNSRNDGDNQLVNVHWIYDESSKSFGSSYDIGLFASSHFMRKLENREHHSNLLAAKVGDDSWNTFSQNLSMYDGIVTHGATFLRINTKKMNKLMENNDSFTVSMLFLVVNCLQHQVKNKTACNGKQYRNLQNQQPPFITSTNLENIRMKSNTLNELTGTINRG